jgi:hypothetical protein
MYILGDTTTKYVIIKINKTIRPQNIFSNDNPIAFLKK